MTITWVITTVSSVNSCTQTTKTSLRILITGSAVIIVSAGYMLLIFRTIYNVRRGIETRTYQRTVKPIPTTIVWVVRLSSKDSLNLLFSIIQWLKAKAISTSTDIVLKSNIILKKEAKPKLHIPPIRSSPFFSKNLKVTSICRDCYRTTVFSFPIFRLQTRNQWQSHQRWSWKFKSGGC